MGFNIREFDKNKDSDNFYKHSFETLVAIKGQPPDMNREEYYEMMVQIVQDYMDQLEKNQIFIAEDENGIYLGHIWISVKDELEIWEYKPYFWLQNVTIVDGFRRQGIATKLMAYVEDWIKNQGYNQIGLHVDGKNDNAINLYKKFQYSVFNTQFFKKINFNDLINDSELKIIQCESDGDFLKVQNFIFSDLRKRVNSSIENSEILNRISKILDHTRNNDTDYIFIINNQIGDSVGYFILYEAEMKFQKTAYIRAFRIHPQADFREFVKNMLIFSEKWAINNQIEMIETLVGSSNPDLLEYLKIIGFMEFGYFMIKRIN